MRSLPTLSTVLTTAGRPLGIAGSRANLARSHFWWARILADRGDAAGARTHAEIAVAMGEELGMDGPFGIVPRGRELLASL